MEKKKDRKDFVIGPLVKSICRKELNRQLYKQMAYGYEKKPYYFDETVLNAILFGDVETLKTLIASGLCQANPGN